MMNTISSNQTLKQVSTELTLPHPILKNSWVWRQISWLQSKKTQSELYSKLFQELIEFASKAESCIAYLLKHRPENPDSERLFYEKVKLLTPPNIQGFPLKTKTQTFNHVNYYMLDQDILWYKSLTSMDQPWKPIYFDGFSEGLIPEELQVDDADLIIKANNEIHYKKILEESRNVHTQEYSYTDISELNNWLPAWFSLPVLEYLQNPFTDNRLKLPSDCRGFAISNRAEFCGRVEDALNVEHLNPLNVTTLYVLEKTGNAIQFFDPYVNMSAHCILPLPETKNSSFVGLSLAASCSTMLLIGYEIRPHDQGGICKTLKVMTEFTDHDLLGNDNLMIAYDFQVNAPKPQSFMLPMPGWMEHTLPLHPPAAITKEGTIFQTGSGNLARELRIAGWNEKRESGYYKKMISNTEWQFVPYRHHYSYAEALPERLDVPDQKFTTTIHDYDHGIMPGIRLLKDAKISLKLCHFGENTFTSTLELKIDHIHVDLLLFKTKGVLNFIFPSLSPEYQLVLPPLDYLNLDEQQLIKGFFNNVMPVTVVEDTHSLRITPTFLTGLNFEISFPKKFKI